MTNYIVRAAQVHPYAYLILRSVCLAYIAFNKGVYLSMIVLMFWMKVPLRIFIKGFLHEKSVCKTIHAQLKV